MTLRHSIALLALLLSPPLSAAPSTQPTPPKFLIGVWYQPTSSFQKWKDRGINTLVGYENEGGQITREQWIAAAKKADLFYIIKPPDDLADVKDELSDPHLLAYTQPDEPDGAGNATPQQIKANYAAWKKAAPNLPVFLNFDGVKVQWRPAADYVEYAKGADWLAFDNYVINRGSGPEAIPLLGTLLDKLAEWSGADAPKKKRFLVVECSDQDLRVQDWLHTKENQPQGEQWAAKMRAPTPDEMRKEVDVAVQHGANGIIYFPDQIGRGWESFDGATPELVDAMKQINAKLTGATAKASPEEIARTKPAPAPAPDPAPLEGKEITIDGVTYTLHRKQ